MKPILNFFKLYYARQQYVQFCLKLYFQIDTSLYQNTKMDVLIVIYQILCKACVLLAKQKLITGFSDRIFLSDNYYLIMRLAITSKKSWNFLFFKSVKQFGKTYISIVSIIHDTCIIKYLWQQFLRVKHNTVWCMSNGTNKQLSNKTRNTFENKRIFQECPEFFKVKIQFINQCYKNLCSFHLKYCAFIKSCDLKRK
eukprot:TRINITY_DN28398_c0_g2_i1.p2 TRINITY_DN28398_c0_g2~~TRINITY_DN28398_c0_g2_i1.p2  ORF type:complete len:197 (-),score=-13.85 TRINITY_DN28398_c0_g2_i1:147-737(-)